MMRKLQTQAKRNTLILLLSTGSILMLPIVQKQLNNIISKIRNTAHLMTLKEKESLIAQELLERLAKLNQKVQDKIKVQLLSMFEYKPKANLAKEAEFFFLSGSAGGLAGLLLRALYQSFQFGVKEDLDPNNENKVNQLINRKVSNMTSLRALFNKWQTTRGVRAFVRALAAAAIVLSQLAATKQEPGDKTNTPNTPNTSLKRPQTGVGELLAQKDETMEPQIKKRKEASSSSSREIKLSEENLKQLKTLKSIQGAKEDFLDALEASAEKLKAQGVDGKRVIEIKPIYHSGEQLPGYEFTFEDGSQKIITRVEYIQMIQPNERSKSSQAGIPARTARRTLGTLLPPITERVNMVDSLPMERIFRTVIVPIEGVEITTAETLMETVIMPMDGVSLDKYITLKIDNTEILDEEKHLYYENSLSEEEIERYDKLRLTAGYTGQSRFTTLKNTNCFL